MNNCKPTFAPPCIEHFHPHRKFYATTLLYTLDDGCDDLSVTHPPEIKGKDEQWLSHSQPCEDLGHRSGQWAAQPQGTDTIENPWGV